MIYLDNAATTKPKTEVLRVIFKSLQEDWYNPSSPYDVSEDVKKKIEQARRIIANKINCHPSEIYFTSSGSESNNMAIKGVLNENKRYQLICDNFMHASVRNIKKHKLLINNDIYGNIALQHLKQLVVDLKVKKDKLALVSIVGGNNEIGTIQDIKSISDIIHKFDGILHVDGVQLFTNQSIDVQDLGIDMLSFSGHKIGCPSGIAVLYVKDNIKTSPIISGEQENKLRGGTENTSFILGIAKAVELLDYKKTNTIKELRNYFIDELSKIPNSYLVGAKDNRLSNNINFCFKSIDASALINYLSIYSIYCSGGSACSSLSLEPSPIIKALGLPEKDIHCCVRFSLSESNSTEEIQEVTNIVKRFVKGSIKRREGTV